MHNLDRVLTQQETFNEVAQEFESYEYQSESAFGGGPLNEAELAAELLTVSNEAEMEQFWGKLISTVAKGAVNFAKSGAGKALGGALKQMAKTALPTVGGALGSMIPIPGVGTAIGTMAGKALAGALEMEAGVQSEEREFEAAQQVVRVAAQATRALESNPAAASNPQAAAAQALKSAINGMRPATASVLGQIGGAVRPLQGNAGRWYRRGNTIVLQGM